MIIKIPIKPFPAVRINAKSIWNDRSQAYITKMNELRLLIWDDKEFIINSMIKGIYLVEFQFKTPKSWSLKKKERMIWSNHKQTPDCDNLLKAFKDTIFYQEDHNDCEVSRSNAIKNWWDEDMIIFYDNLTWS